MAANPVSYHETRVTAAFNPSDRASGEVLSAIVNSVSRNQATESAPAVSAAQEAEQRLVRRARSGDRAAFREIVERYEGLVAATVVGMLGRGPEAEDVGQKTFIRLHQALDQYRGEGGLAPYITRIAVNLSLNELEQRKRRRRRFVRHEPNEGLEPVVDGPREARRFDEQELVHQAIQQLDAKFRAVVTLRLIHGYSTRETAAMLGVPLGTVLSRLHRAQEKLREILAPYLEEDYER